MRKNFRELEAKMSPESRARSNAKAKQILREIDPADELKIEKKSFDAVLQKLIEGKHVKREKVKIKRVKPARIIEK